MNVSFIQLVIDSDTLISQYIYISNKIILFLLFPFINIYSILQLLVNSITFFIRYIANKIFIWTFHLSNVTITYQFRYFLFYSILRQWNIHSNVSLFQSFNIIRQNFLFNILSWSSSCCTAHYICRNWQRWPQGNYWSTSEKINVPWRFRRQYLARYDANMREPT